MAKKKPRPKLISKVILQTNDKKWWTNLPCTEPAKSEQQHLVDGWTVRKRQKVKNPDRPNVTLRVELEKVDTSGDDPIGYIGIG